MAVTGRGWIGQDWTAQDLPDLAGTTALVTGANSGLGLHTSIELARHGCRVLMLCRDSDRGRRALDQVLAAVPGAQAATRPLDLASLAAIRALAGDLAADGVDRVDLLVNNAGVMAIPRRTTQDGFEYQLGVNHLGHFALTGLLLPVLLRGSVLGGPARVVTVASQAHRAGRLDRDDLMAERSYRPWPAYARSKLANLLFFTELRRRVDAAGLRLDCLAAHPGYAATNLVRSGPQASGSRLGGLVLSLGEWLLAQPAASGAWPTLRACADPQARSGEYFGPSGWAGMRGPARPVRMHRRAQDPGDAAWLWQRSVELTGVDFAALTPA